MKKIILLFLISLLCLPSLLAQTEKKNTVYVIGAPNWVHYATRNGVAGGGSYSGRFGISTGVEYSRELFKNFEVLSGVHFSSNNIKANSHMIVPGEYSSERTFTDNFIAIPIQVKYHLSDLIFVNGGGIMNIRVSEARSYPKPKDKFGLLFGIGAKLDFKENYCFIINPYFQVNDLTSDRHQNFYNIGIKLGVGYKF